GVDSSDGAGVALTAVEHRHDGHSVAYRKFIAVDFGDHSSSFMALDDRQLGSVVIVPDMGVGTAQGHRSDSHASMSWREHFRWLLPIFNGLLTCCNSSFHRQDFGCGGQRCSGSHDYFVPSIAPNAIFHFRTKRSETKPPQSLGSWFMISSTSSTEPPLIISNTPNSSRTVNRPEMSKVPFSCRLLRKST